MLSDFFRINLPYGIAKNDQNEWMAFNREYLPIGFNSGKAIDVNSKLDYPVQTKYQSLTEAKLLQLAGNDKDAIQRDAEGNICTVFFYTDRTNPVNQEDEGAEYWNEYFSKIKILSKKMV